MSPVTIYYIITFKRDSSHTQVPPAFNSSHSSQTHPIPAQTQPSIFPRKVELSSIFCIFRSNSLMPSRPRITFCVNYLRFFVHFLFDGFSDLAIVQPGGPAKTAKTSQKRVKHGGAILCGIFFSSARLGQRPPWTMARSGNPPKKKNANN